MSEKEIRSAHPGRFVTQELHGKNSKGKRKSPGQAGVIATKRRPPSLVVGIGTSAGGLAAFKAGHHCPLAPRRVQIVLALEVETAWWSADCSS
jgi:hypothetical protein